jgi:hypothetical protein
MLGGGWRGIDGHHRVKIAVLLSWAELPATDSEDEGGTYATRTIV